MLRAILFVCLVWIAGPAFAERRVALVIGNGSYERVGLLANPPRDAEAVAGALEAAGFEVIRGRDLGLKAMREALRGFRDKLADADVALVYYAGHGIEVGGINYLIPVDAVLAHSDDIVDEAISLARVREAMAGAKRLRVVVLDACRDNPFARSMQLAGRDVPGRGLAAVRDTAASEVIAFAAADGAVASDGEAGNSPFTSAFVKRLNDPSVDVRFLFGGVSDDVRKATAQSGKGVQQPAIYAPNLGGDVVALVPKAEGAARPGPTAPPIVPAVDPDEVIRRDFTNAKTIGTVAAWDGFLKLHANGPFAVAANEERQRLASLQKPPAIQPAQAPNCGPSAGGYRVTGVGQGDVLNIRGGPSTETPIVFMIPPDGAGIERIACPGDGRWCRIRYQCREGWALARLLAEDFSTPASNGIRASDVAPAGGTGYRVTGVENWDQLKVRQSPTGDSPEAGSLPPDARGIEVFRCIPAPDYVFQWCLIRQQRLYGWVYAKYLTRD